MLKHGVADLTATRIPPGRAWEAKVIIISTEGLHNNMLNGGAWINISYKFNDFLISFG